MKVLYIGPKRGNAYIQYLTLKEIYKKVDLIDNCRVFFASNIISRIFWDISPKIIEPLLNYYILSKVKKSYDLIYVKSGDLIGKKLILELKKKTKKIVFFCNDNPFVSRDKKRWKLFLSSGQFYDLIIFQDKSRISLSKKYGIKKTLLVLPPYQKNIHCRQKISFNEKKKYSTNVIFVGTWFPERGIFFKKLIDLGLDLKIYGNLWKKDPNYESMKSKIKLGHVYNPLYSKLIQCAKIALCLTSKGNLDSITARSCEIPAIGTLLCANRTKAHQSNFVENKEAIFFKKANECYKKCKYLLQHGKKIKKIAYRGHIKVTKILKSDNHSLIKKIVSKVFREK